MNRKCFKMTEKAKVIDYLSNQGIAYETLTEKNKDLVKIFVGPHPEDEYAIFDFGEKKAVTVNTYIDSVYLENLDHIEIGWKDNDFSLRLFNDHTDLISFIFYEVKRV